MTNNFSDIQVEVPKVTFSRQRQDEYREVSKSNKRHISRQIHLLPQDPDFGWGCHMVAARIGAFSQRSWDNLPSKTVLQCESWCCVSIATRSRSSSLPCCESEGTCIRHEWCSSTLVELFGQSSLQLWYDSHTSSPILWCVVLNPNV